jgi:hypothetical protein
MQKIEKIDGFSNMSDANDIFNQMVDAINALMPEEVTEQEKPREFQAGEEISIPVNWLKQLSECAARVEVSQGANYEIEDLRVALQDYFGK